MCIFQLFPSEEFWVFLTAIATIALAYIARNQLSINNKISAATFLNEFKSAFFTEQQRVFILLIERRWLIFDENEALFINKTPQDFKDKFPGNDFLRRGYYLTQELDDFLLGHFEDAALLENSKIILIDDVDQHFSYYLSAALENEEVQKYIKWAQEDDPDIYSKTLALKNKLPNS